MNMTSVESSNIAAIGYNPTTQEMQVRFKNGTTYGYVHVEAAVHEKIVKADSVGSEFNRLVKSNPGKYPFKKI